MDDGSRTQQRQKIHPKIMKQLKDGAKELNIVNDKLGTPTYTIDFARNAKLLIEKQLWGVYNMVCGGETGRLEVAKELIRVLGKENDIKINEVDSSFFKDVYFAKRPFSERLVNKKLNLRNANIMRDWKICLKEYVEEYYGNYLD